MLFLITFIFKFIKYLVRKITCKKMEHICFSNRKNITGAGPLWSLVSFYKSFKFTTPFKIFFSYQAYILYDCTQYIYILNFFLVMPSLSLRYQLETRHTRNKNIMCIPSFQGDILKIFETGSDTCVDLEAGMAKFVMSFLT